VAEYKAIVTSPIQTPKRYRFWRWFRRTAVIVAVLVGGLALYGWWYFARIAAEGKADLAAAIAETDALDPDWRWEALEAKRANIPDVENSINVINKVAEALHGQNLLRLEAPDGGPVFDDWPTNRLLDDVRLGIVRESLSRCPEAVELASSLKRFPRGRVVINFAPDLLSTLLPHTDKLRSVLRLLGFDSERTLHGDRPHEAAQAVVGMVFAGAALRDEPFLISQLVRQAARAVAVRRTVRVLGLCEIPDSQCQSLIDLFQGESDEDVLLCAVRGERAGFNRLFENLEDGRVDLGGFLLNGRHPFGTDKPGLQERVVLALYRSRLHEDHAQFLRLINEVCRIAQLPFEDQRAEWQNLRADLVAKKAQATREVRWMVAIFLMPAFDKVAQSAQRDQALLRCIITALAAERFRLANKGWPKTLNDLCPQFLPKVPTDPYDGEPLRLARREDGIVIYTVGADGEDNGGEHLDPNKPSDTGSSDLGIRLWNPDHRRLPPEAEKSQNPDG
jgi:hypothetical protein